MMQPDPSQIRPAQFADDQWYPSSANRLRQALDSLLQSAPKRDLDRLLGLVSPHAGLRFSGAVAAHAYRQLEGRQYSYVAVISPVHRRPLGPYAVTQYRYSSTPLGLIPVAEEFVQELAREIPVSRVGRDDEHSLEIQLPFIQHLLKDFQLLPIMMGDQSLAACQELAQALSNALEGESALIVASSDLSHFHSYDTAVELDALVSQRIAAYDPEGLADILARGQAEACGGGPIITAMLACRHMGAERATILHYANSGDVWVDRSSVVGYLAAALH